MAHLRKHKNNNKTIADGVRFGYAIDLPHQKDNP